MKPSQSPESYVYEESPESRGDRRNPSGSETLTALRSDLSRFYRLNHKLRSLNNAPGHERPDAMVSKLNRMLQAQGLGGRNGGSESRAYFVTDGREVLLVANSVVDGKEVSSRQALAEAFEKIDRLIADPFTVALAGYESRIGSISAEYAEATNDVFRGVDAVMNFTGKIAKKVGSEGWEGADASYERRVAAVRGEASETVRLFEKHYAKRLESIGKDRITSGNLTSDERQELAILQTQKVRFEKLKGAKLESPPWITAAVAKEILTPEWLKEAGKNVGRVVAWAGYGIAKSVYESAKFFFYETPVFLYQYSTDEKFSTQVDQAVSEAKNAISKYAKEHGGTAMVSDFFRLLARSIGKEYEEIKKLPQDQQAFRIGEIVGNVLLILMGPKLAKDTLRSGALRIKSSAEKVSALRAAGKVVEISKVRTWDDLESAVSHIQRIRGRGEVGDLRMAVQRIRMGAEGADLKNLPNAGGIREAAKLLLKNGGYVSEKQAAQLSNWVDSWVEMSKKAYRKTADSLVSIAPDADFARKMQDLSRIGREFESLRGIHDALDTGIVSLRTKMASLFSGATGDRAGILFSDLKAEFSRLAGTVEIAGVGNARVNAVFRSFSSAMKSVAPFVEAVSDAIDHRKAAVRQVISGVRSRTKEVLANVEKASETLRPAVDAVKSKIDDAEAAISSARNRLPVSVRRHLVFEGGFATYQNPATNKIRYVRPDGSFLCDSKWTPLEFFHGSNFSKHGAVVQAEGQGFGFLDRNGKMLIEPKFQSLRELSGNRKIVEIDGKFQIFEKGKDGKFSALSELGDFDSVSDPFEGRAFATKTGPDGKKTTHMLRGEGKASQTFTTSAGNERYDLFDDFTEDGFVAVRSAKGNVGSQRWHILDREGNRYGLRKDGPNSPGFEAEDAAHALNRFRDAKMRNGLVSTTGEMNQRMIENLLTGRFPQLAGKKYQFEATASQDVFRISKRLKGGKDELKGFVNVKTGAVVEPRFDMAHYSDVPEGYLRVRKDGHWGLIDVRTGEMDINPSYSKYESLTVVNERLGLFEAEVAIADSVEEAGQSARKVGLVSSNGKVLIEPKFDRIIQPREGFYRGVNEDPRFPGRIVGRSPIFDTALSESAKHAWGGANFHADGFWGITKATIEANNVRMRAVSIQKTVDPFHRVIKRVTPEKFFAADPELFGPGKMSFAKVLKKNYGHLPPSRLAIEEEFEQYASQRAHDFVEHYASTQGRPLSPIEAIRVRGLFSGEMKDRLHARLNHLSATSRTDRSPALDEALKSYLETRRPSPGGMSYERVQLPFAEPLWTPQELPDSFARRSRPEPLRSNAVLPL